MISLATLSTWIALTVPHLVDPQGRHFVARQLPVEARDAFAVACIERDPFPSDDDGRVCAAFLVVMAGLESGFSLHPNGSNDHGLAAGPFQEWRGGELRTRSWIDATRHYLATVRDAMRACPEQTIAQLAGERCGESRIHVVRWAKVRELALMPLPEAVSR
jgi:hypothetical protein